MSDFKLIVKKYGVYNPELYDIYKINFGNNFVYNIFRYITISDSDFWFTLVNKDNQIIGECSIYIRHDSNIKTFEIQDVFIEPKFRGNNYAELMLLNVLSYLNQHYTFYNYIIRTHSDNIPAIKTYTKICGEPLYYNHKAIFIYNHKFTSFDIQ